jgi:hypothetical protein
VHIMGLTKPTPGSLGRFDVVFLLEEFHPIFNFLLICQYLKFPNLK